MKLEKCTCRNEAHKALVASVVHASSFLALGKLNRRDRKDALEPVILSAFERAAFESVFERAKASREALDNAFAAFVDRATSIRLLPDDALDLARDVLDLAGKFEAYRTDRDVLNERLRVLVICFLDNEIETHLAGAG